MKNRKFKDVSKLMKVMIVTLLFVLSLSGMTFAAKAKTKTTVKKTISMNQGVSGVVNAGVKASWKSADTNIVSLKKSGNGKKAVLTARRAGKTKVTASIKGKKKKIVWTVTVSASASGSAAGKNATVSIAALHAAGTAGMSAAEAAAYKAIIGMTGNYPEGMAWPNTAETYYAWNGGIWRGGYGCASFAFLLSDAAFDGRQAVKIDVLPDKSNVSDVIRSWLHVGDIIRVDSNGVRNAHSVVVLQKTSTGIVVAEGNYNSSVHWGRVISYSELSSELCYVLTRYELDTAGNVIA